VQFRNKHGGVATMNVSNIGTKPQKQYVTVEVTKKVVPIKAVYYVDEPAKAGQEAELPRFGPQEINRLNEIIEMAETADHSYRPQLKAAVRKLAKIVGCKVVPYPRSQKPKRSRNPAGNP
jgi:hypothetical protein